LEREALKSKSRRLKILLNSRVPFEAARENQPLIFALKFFAFLATLPLYPPPLPKGGGGYYEEGLRPSSIPWLLFAPGLVLPRGIKIVRRVIT